VAQAKLLAKVAPVAISTARAHLAGARQVARAPRFKA
jgi:hypothetical protein